MAGIEQDVNAVTLVQANAERAKWRQWCIDAEGKLAQSQAEVEGLRRAAYSRWAQIDYQKSVFVYEQPLVQLWHRLWDRGVSVGFYNSEKNGWFLLEPDGGLTGVDPSHWAPLDEPPDEAALAPDARTTAGEAGKVFCAPLDDIAAERKRQVEVEGWSTEHDDQYEYGEMAMAAAAYASHVEHREQLDVFAERAGAGRSRVGWFLPHHLLWPWAREWWKPTTRRRDLVKAGALIVAEIERLDRAEAAVLALAGAGE